MKTKNPKPKEFLSGIHNQSQDSVVHIAKKEINPLPDALRGFNLSEKIEWNYPSDDEGWITKKDVRSFINLICAKVLMDWKGQNEFIDWLQRKAGEDLK
jgi:hypothetical protein